VIVTSRAPLRLRWEQELLVSPLALPDLQQVVAPSDLAQAPAVALFAERARAVRHDFVLGARNAWAVAELCVRLDGLPLAIELAAARTRVLSAPALLSQLAESHEGRTGALRVLTDGPRDLPARQQTLRAAIAWSHALLTPAEQRLFRRLAVFAGGCTIEAAERVCEASWTDIASLVEKSLIRYEAGAVDPGAADRAPRVRLLEMVREYAAEQLVAGGEEEATRRRHLAFYVDLAEAAEPGLFGPEQDVWLARLDQERDNLRLAERWALGAGDGESVLRLAAALIRFWLARGAVTEVRERVHALVALAAAAPTHPAAVTAFSGAGDQALLLGDFLTAQSLFEQSLEVARRLDDRPGMATALRALSKLASHRGNYAEAHRLGADSLALLEQGGGLPERATTLRRLGYVSHFAGDQLQARLMLERALAMAREIGDLRLISNTAFGLAMVHHVTGNHDLAWQLYEECLAIDRLQGHRASEGSALNNLGHIATLRGERRLASALLRDSLLASRDGGDRRRLGFTLSAVAGLVTIEGDPVRAIRLDAAGRAALDGLGARLEPPMRSQYDELLASARDALGADAVLAAEAAGRAMTLDQAVFEALTWLADANVPSEAVGSPALVNESTTGDESAGASESMPGRDVAPPTAAPAGAAVGGAPHPLTPRELAVARLIAQGFSNRQIAAELVITEGTTSNYVQRVMSRLGFHARAQVAAWVVERGLNEPSQE
jgi:predicted ATPase/DNA-binding NarL/FixJ family response regulator